MKKKLQVYTVNYDGRQERCVAAYSRSQAAKLMNVSYARLRDYGSISGNSLILMVCCSNPQIVYERSLGDYTSYFKRVEQ